MTDLAWLLIAEEDGVRLGCYGHTADDGKKFSTHYVADAKGKFEILSCAKRTWTISWNLIGYRLVSPKGLINVFPKDGGEPRNASFSESFTEDEVRSSNIRYFFPAGCHSGRFDEIPIPPIQKKDDAIKIPETTTEVITEPPTTITEEIVTEEPIAIMPAIERCENECCDDKFARIILSKSKTGISKIVIPIETDLLSRCSIEEIVDITSETDNVKLLTMLLKFVKRYKL